MTNHRKKSDETPAFTSYKKNERQVEELREISRIPSVVNWVSAAIVFGTLLWILFR